MGFIFNTLYKFFFYLKYLNSNYWSIFYFKVFSPLKNEKVKNTCQIHWNLKILDFLVKDLNLEE